ncbi:MAG: YwiC-like family protein [Psittacicella sp.]
MQSTQRYKENRYRKLEAFKFNQISIALNALLPAIYGFIFASIQTSYHLSGILFLLLWISCYLISYPFYESIANKKITNPKKLLIYGSIIIILWILLSIIYIKINIFLIPIIIAIGFQSLFQKFHIESYFIAEFINIIFFSIMGYCSYLATSQDFIDIHSFNYIFLTSASFLIGALLFRKSKTIFNTCRRYMHASVIYHSLILLISLIIDVNIGICFIIPWARAIILSNKNKKKLKHIRPLETIIYIAFFSALLATTFISNTNLLSYSIINV